jgi:cell division protease FtsH
MNHNDNYKKDKKDNYQSIDEEFISTAKHLKELKKKRNNELRNIKGVKVSNDTEIEEYFEKIIQNLEKDDDKNISDYDDDDELPNEYNNFRAPGIKIIFNGNNNPFNNNPFNNNPFSKNIQKNTENDKSENFEILKNNSYSFKDVGGYNLIKQELLQCADLLTNYEKYSKYNVRTPKGLILEGPPGNGKTLLAKSFSGEIDVGFIPVSGSQFLEKYVGVGSSRVRELFSLAKENVPCIIFIDEIDAMGRQRSGNGESHNAERDTTLNELLVSLDGFKSTNGIFVIGATNRVDLLDSALTRPGRIDKTIYIGNPDRKTREAIIDIHIQGKPYEKSINIENLIEMTNGFSCAQIENFLNEAMLFALRNNREIITQNDLEIISNRILVGWQSTENILSEEMLYQVAIHEMGHALIGLFTNYKKLLKVTINLWSPKSLGFTLFEPSEDDTKLQLKDKLICELMVLLGGRIAEEIFFENKISSGASQDIEQAKKITENMIIKLGMGKKMILPYASEKYKEQIDKEIEDLINEAYHNAKVILLNSKPLLDECAKLLVIEHELTREMIVKKIKNKYSYLNL